MNNKQILKVIRLLNTSNKNSTTVSPVEKMNEANENFDTGFEEACDKIIEIIELGEESND